jgi:HSP90 family molecular chaperone
MEKINRAQAFANQEKASSYMLAKKILEINPSHPVMKELLQRIKNLHGAEPDKET